MDWSRASVFAASKRCMEEVRLRARVQVFVRTPSRNVPHRGEPHPPGEGAVAGSARLQLSQANDRHVHLRRQVGLS